MMTHLVDQGFAEASLLEFFRVIDTIPAIMTALDSARA
jgi:hypothetical protein